jgi:hypothetical protein
MPYEDLPLDLRRPTAGQPVRPPRPNRASTRWGLVVAGAIVAGSALVFWWLTRSQPMPTAPAPTAATDVAIRPNRPKRQMIDLPPLQESDALLRQLVSTLSQHPLLARLLATPALVESATLTVVQIGDGRTPATPLLILRPSARLQLAGSGDGPIDPASYTRWNNAASALASVDPAEFAQLYVNIKPLVDQSYRELGYPGDFDDALGRAFRMLLETPAQKTEPDLLRRANYFEHQDPDLRALKPVQKQFMLLGPANRERVAAWLRAVATRLDLKTS